MHVPPLLLALVFALPGRASAQALPASSPPAAGAPDSAATPFAGLALTAGQRARLQALTATMRAAQHAILARQTPGTVFSVADRTELTRLALAHNAAVRAVLTGPQRGRFDTRVQAWETNRAHERAARLRAPRTGGVR